MEDRNRNDDSQNLFARIYLAIFIVLISRGLLIPMILIVTLFILFGVGITFLVN